MPRRRPLDDRCLFSIEQECLTVVEGSDDLAQVMHGVHKLVHALHGLAPGVVANCGVFTPYGRVYEDCGHVEFALAECDSPQSLVRMNEQAQMLAWKALERLRAQGIKLRLFNNNHGGLLQGRAPTWGSHENHLVDVHPMELEHTILPFLVTRLYAGSGGVRFPTGQFVASVRSEFMRLPSGGSTTRNRAIHSTCREENLVGGGQGFRYHMIGADGHRSQFNLGLLMGTTALVLKAILRDDELAPTLRERFPQLPLKGCWVKTLHQLNRLGRPGREPIIDPLVVDVQMVYVESVERTLAAMDTPPEWGPQLVADWRQTLEAYATNDRPWLASHLDTFTKYELFSGLLAERGSDWGGLRRNLDLFSRLALLDQGYHEFENPQSPFEIAEANGLLAHRIVERVGPGAEERAFVPDVSTRARPRAEYLVQAWNDDATDGVFMDWTGVVDRDGARRMRLEDPFASAFTPWQAIEPPPDVPF